MKTRCFPVRVMVDMYASKANILELRSMVAYLCSASGHLAITSILFALAPNNLPTYSNVLVGGNCM